MWETMNMDDMREEYDFRNGKKNPYIDKLKTQITIELDDRVINYFKNEAKVSGIPYQTLINLYLLDCVKNNKKIQITWK